MYERKWTFRKLETLIVAKLKQCKIKNNVQTLKVP